MDRVTVTMRSPPCWKPFAVVRQADYFCLSAGRASARQRLLARMIQTRFVGGGRAASGWLVTPPLAILYRSVTGADRSTPRGRPSVRPPPESRRPYREPGQLRPRRVRRAFPVRPLRSHSWLASLSSSQ